ncbi:MAG TPA: type VI secretion system tube protein Hcp [Polyangiales bacterium]|nr:type VI secretion system tube protein Hcp [Polyangiales bacterium]
MPSNIFLKVPGARGTSKQEGKTGWIDVISWKWGMTLPSDGQADVISKGRASVADVEIKKYHDGSSSDLMKACVGGKQFTDSPVKLVMTKTKDKKEVDFLTLQLEGAVVLKVDFEGGDPEHQDRLIETVALRFMKFSYEYQAEGDSAGTADLVFDVNRCALG